MIKMDEVHLSKEEFVKIKNIYRSIMSYASIGLFAKSGEAIGEIIGSKISRDAYFEEAKKILIEKGWVKDITFEKDKVITRGSIEAHPSDKPTCDMLRGIIRKLYEIYYEELVKVTEEECESMGKENCVFKIHRLG